VCAASLKAERKAKTILRSFDLNYDFGPCVGIPRMDRWERAHRRGLNPPEIVGSLCYWLDSLLTLKQVKLILETEKAEDLSNEDLEALRNPVFHGML
jgi:hypothetical protein